MRGQPDLPAAHSPAWVVQSWLSFVVAILAMSLGIYALPDGGWVKGFLAMGLLFTVGSSLSLAKTVRDLHDATRITARIDEARVTKLIAEHDPLKPAI
jgi:hypothetical protein